MGLVVQVPPLQDCSMGPNGLQPMVSPVLLERMVLVAAVAVPDLVVKVKPIVVRIMRVVPVAVVAPVDAQVMVVLPEMVVVLHSLSL